MTPIKNGARGFSLAIIFVIGLLTQFTMCADNKCFKYRCADKDTTIISTVLPNLAPILSQFPKKDHCAKSEPTETADQCIQADQDTSGCIAVITTITVPYQGDVKLVYKNCTNVVDCYNNAYPGVLTDGGDPKCHHYTYEQVQGGKPAEDGDITAFTKCAEGKGEDLTGGLAGAQGQARQGDSGGAQELAKQVTLGFCICRGNMCNEQSRIDKALEKVMAKGKGTSTTPAANEAQGLLLSKGVFSFLVGAHFLRKFLSDLSKVM